MDWYEHLLSWPGMLMISLLGGVLAARKCPEDRWVVGLAVAAALFTGFILAVVLYVRYEGWTWF